MAYDCIGSLSSHCTFLIGFSVIYRLHNFTLLIVLFLVVYLLLQ